jgi:hypothetical protein
MLIVSKGKKDATPKGLEVAIAPMLVLVALHPLDKLKIAFLDTLNGDYKKLKSFLI